MNTTPSSHLHSTDQAQPQVDATSRIPPGERALVLGGGGSTGNAWLIGFIAGLLEGLPELDVLKLASAVGASCVRAVGTTAGVFTRAEADAFIARHDLVAEPF